MGHIELIIRALLRRSGLAGWILRLLDHGARSRRNELRNEYARTRPDRAVVTILGRSATLKVTNAEEYAHYLAEPESRVMKVVFENLRPDDTVWDVGANIGLYTILIGAAVGPAGTVIAFEPMPPCFERLKENIALNIGSGGGRPRNADGPRTRTIAPLHGPGQRRA